jgi:hypothetical protein
VVATDVKRAGRFARVRRWLSSLRGGRGALVAVRAAQLLGGAMAATSAGAVALPEDRAEAMAHLYDGGGTKASGPAVLVRKSVNDQLALSASYYVDMVSNASIDVVTTASPYHEKREAYDLGLDYVVRDSLMTLTLGNSKEPDYIADTWGADISHDVFGGMTTVSLGFTHGSDRVGKKDIGFFDTAHHWQYRLGVTQILTPRWLASVNTEVVSDDGFLGSPYRVARVFGAAVPERNPRTRTSRAVKFRVIGDVGDRDIVHADYRYFWDTWEIRSHTVETGYSRYFGNAWLADSFVRFNSQHKASFYSDNATSETTYVSRNRQLGTYTDVSVGASLSYTFAQVPGVYDAKVHAGYEFVHYNYKDFTDIRTGSLYSYNASVLQLYLTANF